MRLSAYVSANGVDAFTRDDFVFVGSKVETDPARLILVGGQAIETWGIVFDVLAPTGDQHPLTEDTDWLGSASDANWLCQLLGKDTTELQLPAADDPTINTGVAFLKRPDGRVLVMDFLRCIAGCTNEEVRRLAVPISVLGITLHVLHPLLCLESRLANVARIESKRLGNGPIQARWSIDIVRAYLSSVADKQARRELVRACHRVANAAEFNHGRFCYVEFGIDPLEAVTPELVAKIGGLFEERDWPNTISRIKLKRTRWRRIRTARAF